MRFLGFFRKSEPFLEGSARCGRCASLLPDETLSYCPKCGVPFSRVPPTDQYELISDRVHSLFLSEHKKNLILRSSGIFALFWVFALALSAVNNQMEIQKIREQRSVHFYVQQDPAYPMLSNYQINQSISIAIQSFEDHFGMHIPELRISYNRSAPQLAKHPEYESKKTSLSFWEAQIFPQLTRDWEKDPYQELPVLISNFPIYNDLGKISPINTLHLNAHGLVSGLGHPALSVVSSYRMFHDQKSLFEAKDISHDWHQYLGEYVIAHELGHALLALPDFVEGVSDFRNPASVDSNWSYSSCLMHTDAGGGYKAWKALKGRKIAAAPGPACAPYQATLEAFRLRKASLEALQSDDPNTAQQLHAQSLKKLESQGNSWLLRLWQKEHLVFLSPPKRWWSQIFMIESFL